MPVSGPPLALHHFLRMPKTNVNCSPKPIVVSSAAKLRAKTESLSLRWNKRRSTDRGCIPDQPRRSNFNNCVEGQVAAPSVKTALLQLVTLKFGVWSFPGAWILVFGAFLEFGIW